MRDIIAIILTSLLPFGTTIAEAHAFLDHAEPRVGSTVQTAPREISLAFDRRARSGQKPAPPREWTAAWDGRTGGKCGTT